MNKKAIIILIIVILIICLAIGFLVYMRRNDFSNYIELNNIGENTQTLSDTNNVNNNEIINNNKLSTDYMEIGSKENRGFIVDNVLHSKAQGDIHFSSYLPKDYNKDKKYAIYFALPGWEGLYFQGVGANLVELYPCYFTSRGYSDEHAGCGSFAYEENIMNWVFSKSR